MRNIGLRSPLLLITFAVALAGVGADWRLGPDAPAGARMSSAGGRHSGTLIEDGDREKPAGDEETAAGRRGSNASIEAVEPWASPGSPAVVRARRLSSRCRALDAAPHDGVTTRAAHWADDRRSFVFARSTVSLAGGRSRLDFAHDTLIARTAARSAFGTSLPPPLQS